MIKRNVHCLFIFDNVVGNNMSALYRSSVVPKLYRMTTQPFRFVHPGTFISPKMTSDLPKTSASNPIRKKALEKLLKNTRVDYKPQALEVVEIDWGGRGVGHKECTEDGEMAVQAALLFWATSNVSYGNLALRILSAWANTNKVFRGKNAVLEASWSMCSMARAAELMKYSSMEKQWQVCEPSVFAWLRRIIIPLLQDRSIWRWGFHNNWHFSNLCARMQISILLEDASEWEHCVSTYTRILPSAFVCGCVGEVIETKRDVTHAMFLLGGMTQLPEMAYHQGVKNLWDHRLLDAVELQAQIMLQEVPSGLPKESMKTPYGF